LQNSTNPICTTTFVVEPDPTTSKAISSNNITGILHNINMRKGIARKQEEKPEYFKSFQVQNSKDVINDGFYEINHKEKEIEKKLTQSVSESNNTSLLSSVKVQRAYRNC
jgi:hypothetical protein